MKLSFGGIVQDFGLNPLMTLLPGVGLREEVDECPSVNCEAAASSRLEAASLDATTSRGRRWLTVLQ